MRRRRTLEDAGLRFLLPSCVLWPRFVCLFARVSRVGNTNFLQVPDVNSIDPHIRITGKVDEVARAKEMVMAVLDVKARTRLS